MNFGLVGLLMMAAVMWVSGHHDIKNSALVTVKLGADLKQCFVDSDKILLQPHLTILHVAIKVKLGSSGSGLLGGLLGGDDDGLLGGLLGGLLTNPDQCREFAEQHTLPGRFTLATLVQKFVVSNLCGRRIYFRSYRNGTVFTANGRLVWKGDDDVGKDMILHNIERPLWLPANGQYHDDNILDFVLQLLCKLLGIDLSSLLSSLGLGNILGLKRETAYSYFLTDLDDLQNHANTGVKGAPLAGRALNDHMIPGYVSKYDMESKGLKNVNGNPANFLPQGDDKFGFKDDVFSDEPDHIFQNGNLFIGESVKKSGVAVGRDGGAGGLLNGILGGDGNVVPGVASATKSGDSGKLLGIV